MCAKKWKRPLEFFEAVYCLLIKNLYTSIHPMSRVRINFLDHKKSRNLDFLDQFSVEILTKSRPKSWLYSFIIHLLTFLSRVNIFQPPWVTLFFNFFTPGKQWSLTWLTMGGQIKRKWLTDVPPCSGTIGPMSWVHWLKTWVPKPFAGARRGVV